MPVPAGKPPSEPIITPARVYRAAPSKNGKHPKADGATADSGYADFPMAGEGSGHTNRLRNFVTPDVTPPPASPPAPPADAGNDLPELCREPDLVGAIRRDLRSVGVVGEADNALLVYLAYTSRLLADPLAVVTRGPSSSGKSTLLNRVARLFPDECRVDAMKFTDASLFNAPPDYLSHKILITGERKHSEDDETRDANAMIRQLLSEKRISRMTSVGGGEGKGRWVADNQIREGPVAYAESTTKGSIFEEDLNRLLQLYMDESPIQNRAVANAVASRYDPDAEEADEGEVVGRHHAFQRSLVASRVVVPYWKELSDGIPVGKVQSRRVVQQVFSVLESITLLRQHQRERDARGRLVATPDDYRLTRRLLVAPLHESLGVGEVYREYARLKAGLGVGGKEFDSKQALAFYANKMTRDRQLKKLVENGLLQQTLQGSSHIPSRWRWRKGVSLDTLVLPTVKAVTGEK